jgi:8-oxo-dGTP diphosphatase
MSKPKISVAVFIIKNNKVILEKRKASKKLTEDTYSLPGGHLEQFETLETAVKRETLEETGLKIKNLKYIDFTSDMYKKANHHYITFFFTAEYLSGTPIVTEPRKCKSLDWFSLKEFPKKVYLPLQHFLKKHSLESIFKKY